MGAFLGDEIDNDQKVRKVIRALPPSWEVKTTTLRELNNKKKMELIALISNLRPIRWKEKLIVILVNFMTMSSTESFSLMEKISYWERKRSILALITCDVPS